jgi:hypothetical protein
MPNAQLPTCRTRRPYLYALEIGLQSYTQGHWVAQVPWDRHFPYPLTWAPEWNFGECMTRNVVIDIMTQCKHVGHLSFGTWFIY